MPEWNGVDKLFYVPMVTFAPRGRDGTLTGKNLLPQREQILSCNRAILIPWKQVVEIIPASPFHSFHSMC